MELTLEGIEQERLTKALAALALVDGEACHVNDRHGIARQALSLALRKQVERDVPHTYCVVAADRR